MMVVLIIFDGDESRGVCGIASDIEHADMLLGRQIKNGTFSYGKFEYYEVEVDVDWPKFPFQVVGRRLENPAKDDKEKVPA